MRLATRLSQLEKKAAVAIASARPPICPDCQTIDAATGARVIGWCWVFPLDDGSGRTGIGCKSCQKAFTARVQTLDRRLLAMEVVPWALAEFSPV